VDTLATVVSLVLAFGLLGSGTATLAKAPPIVANITGVGWPEDRLWVLAVLKLAGAVGLVVGVWVTGLGVAAAIGVVLYFVGAIVFHVRVKNYEVAPALLFLVLGVASLVLQLASA
jgi:hypothetical protein